MKSKAFNRIRKKKKTLQLSAGEEDKQFRAKHLW